MKIDIIKIGNSKGIRLPKAVLEQLGLTEEAELEIRGNEAVIRAPRRQPRAGWEAQFQTALEKHGPPDGDLLLGDFANAFDEAEWTWPDEGKVSEAKVPEHEASQDKRP